MAGNVLAVNRAKPWSDDEELWAIIVAAGSGSRFGGLKQLEMLGGSSILDRSVQAMGCPGRSIVVLPESLVDSTTVAGADCVAGGASRSSSVRAGLAALGPSAKRVLIHDAARPLVTDEVVARVLVGLDRAPAVIPVVPVSDTLRTRDGEPLDRADFVAVQTPQGFDVAAIRAAHRANGEASDDASLVSAAGGEVIHVAGDPSNLKITARDDLLIAEALLVARERLAPREALAAPEGSEQRD